MNLEYFIANRLNTIRKGKGKASSPIIKIATLAIAISIVMMIVSVAISIGLQNKIREKVAAFSGHIIISNFDDNQSGISVVPISTNQDFYPNFTTIDGVKHIQAVATKSALIRTKETVEGIIFKGVGNDYNWKNLKTYITAGRLPEFTDKFSNEIIISEHLANKLHFKVNDICRTYFLKNTGKGYNLRSFKIVGIFNSRFQEFDANYIIGSITHIQKINKWKPTEIGAFEVFLSDFSSIEQKGKEIYKTIPSTYNSVTIAEKYYTLFEWLKLFDFNTVVILVIMIVVAIINMIVALLVLILERTQTIGILKSLGANNWLIRKVFLYNAFQLISKGLLLGNSIALSLLLLQKHFKIITLNPENYHVTTVPININFLHIFSINIATIIICILVLIIPSYIITKISPTEALKFS